MRRQLLIASSVVLLVGGAFGIIAGLISIKSQADRAIRVIDGLCAYQRAGKVEGDHRFEFSQTIAAQDAKGWRAAAAARRVNAVEAAAAHHPNAVRDYLAAADAYDAIADQIDKAALTIQRRPPPPCN